MSPAPWTNDPTQWRETGATSFSWTRLAHDDSQEWPSQTQSSFQTEPPAAHVTAEQSASMAQPSHSRGSQAAQRVRQHTTNRSSLLNDDIPPPYATNSVSAGNQHMPENINNSFQGLPPSTNHSSIKTEGNAYYAPMQPSPPQLNRQVLPSFSKLEKHAGQAKEQRRDGADLFSHVARPCQACTTLEPLIHETAAAVQALDASVRFFLKKSDVPVSDSTDHGPVSAIQRVLERVQALQRDLDDVVSRPTQSGYFFSQPSASAKRAAACDADDLPPHKRHRSIDAEVEQRPSSGNPRMSPGESNAGTRPLPSPTSLVLPPALHPVSPAPSHSTSLHNPSTDPVTSQHIADLQHQVTLKTLSLQTLQSEYSALLQKLQRERTKSLTIERKTTVSEQEVSDLTSRNEELTEQVRGLESQLENVERRRDAERSDTAKERDQWGRMLEMSGRLQAKYAQERQSLADELVALKARLSILEGGHMSSPSNNPTADDDVGKRRHAHDSTMQDNTDLRHEVVRLSDKVALLTRALDDARQDTERFAEKTRSALSDSEKIRDTINRALQPIPNDFAAPTEPYSITRKPPFPALPTISIPDSSKAGSPPSLTAPRLIASNPEMQHSPPPFPPFSGARNSQSNTLLTPLSAIAPPVPDLLRAAKSLSPDARGTDMNMAAINVRPTTSSPEELVEALNSAAPLPPFRPLVPHSHSTNERTSSAYEPPPAWHAVPSSSHRQHHRQAPSASASSSSNHSSPQSNGSRHSSLELGVDPTERPRSTEQLTGDPHGNLPAGRPLACFRQWSYGPGSGSGHAPVSALEGSMMPPPPMRRPSLPPLPSQQGVASSHQTRGGGIGIGVMSM